MGLCNTSGKNFSVIFLEPLSTDLNQLVVGQRVVLIDLVDEVADQGPHTGVLDDLSSPRQDQALTELPVEGGVL